MSDNAPRTDSADTAVGRDAIAAGLHAYAESSAEAWTAARSPDASARDRFVTALLHARERALDLAVDAVPSSVGMTLSMFAGMTGARAAVEVGTGTGVSGQWLLRGMRQDGVLTTIDVEPEHQRAAREGFAEAGFAAARSRLICGRAAEVLPRLADGSYDLVFIDDGDIDTSAYLTHATRLLRPGGMLAVHGVLGAGRPWDSTRLDPAAADARETVRILGDDPRLLSAVVPVSGGLVCASRA